MPDDPCTIFIEDGASLAQWLAQLETPAMAEQYDAQVAERRRQLQQYGQYAAPEPSWPATIYEEGGPSCGDESAD